MDFIKKNYEKVLLGLVLFGLVIVGFMLLEPHGLVRIWRRVKDYVRLWPFSY